MTDQDHGTNDDAKSEIDLVGRCVELLKESGQGTIATQSIKHAGFPFCSVMPYALGTDGKPLFLISSMANHTRNIKADDRVCLLVAAQDSGDRLAGSRVSVMGKAILVSDNERDASKAAYLKVHPSSQQWVDFGDFAFYRLEIEDVYIVAGFGAMGWVEPDNYLSGFSLER